MPLQERVQQSSERNRGTKKSIYIILYCAEYLQAFCAIEVMLCAGHAQRSLPCDHYTSSCTDDPWLICFFMSSAFFAINAFVLKQLFSVFFFSTCCLQLYDYHERGSGRINSHLCAPGTKTRTLPVQPIKISQLAIRESILESHIVSCYNYNYLVKSCGSNTPGMVVGVSLVKCVK